MTDKLTYKYTDILEEELNTLEWMQDMFFLLSRAQNRVGFYFVGLKWFRDDYLPKWNLSWSSCQEASHDHKDKIITTEEFDKIKKALSHDAVKCAIDSEIYIPYRVNKYINYKHNVIALRINFNHDFIKAMDMLT